MPIKQKKRALVAMSGGVDSSVSAVLLQEQGYDVIGATLQVWDYSKNPDPEGCGTCCSSVDVQDARSVCDVLNIPFYTLNSEGLFEDKVIRPFVRDYLKGQTPVPCSNCNTFLKFHYLVKKMDELECDVLATGHYAQIKPLGKGRYGLFAGKDSLKDQSWFLFTLEPALLKRLLFPVGEMSKSEVRDTALKKALPVFKKKDSTGICFVGKGNYRSFVEDYTQKKALSPSFRAGYFKDKATGRVLGRHPGIHHFTIGQRKGLGLSFDRPRFVVHIDSQNGDVFIGEEKDLYARSALLRDLHWLDKAKEGEELHVKVRFHDKGSPAHVKNKGDSWLLEFAEPKKALAPGQSAVFYRKGGQVLGGGTIQSARPS